jgi:hypothetical protein
MTVSPRSGRISKDARETSLVAGYESGVKVGWRCALFQAAFFWFCSARLESRPWFAQFLPRVGGIVIIGG